MKRRGTFLAMVVMLTWAVGVQAQSKSISELLQEGMYAEKTEGDLDKAIGLYEQILERSECTKTMEASATYHLGLCHLKKGDKAKAAQYFRQAIEQYPDQSSMIRKAETHLKKLAPAHQEEQNSGTFYGGLYGQAPVEVWSTLSGLYGQACARAGMKNLRANSNIHLVNSDFISWHGGYNYYQNSTQEPISGRVRLGGTTYPHQKHYDIMGNVLNTEIVPDERPGRENYYHVYLNLPQTLPPGQYFPYGWAKDGFQKLAPASLQQDQYLLNMTNRYGSHAMEVFYLIVPNPLVIISEETPTETTMVGDYTICAWEKEVQPNETHTVMVTLSKEAASNATQIKGWVEDFFQHNYRDITHRETLEWGEPSTDKDGNISIRYKYEATIWDKDKIIQNKVWTFDKDGEFLWVRKFGAEDIYSSAGAQALVEVFFANNYQDITQRKTLEWGEPIKHDNGNVSIRYKYEATIRDKDVIVRNKVWTFDQDGKFVSVEETTLDPLKADNLIVEGWKLLHLKKIAEAEEVFKEATLCDPKNDRAFQGLGRAQSNQGKRHHAQTAYKACIALNPKNFAALNELGWIAHAQDQKDEAIAWWEKAVQASKGADKWSLSGLAQVYMERQEVDLAIKYYQMWLKVEPNNEQAKTGLEAAQKAQQGQ